MTEINAIPIFTDNYVWAIVIDNKYLVVVDPGDAQPVLDFCSQHCLELHSIIITHRHPDHTGGVVALKQKYSNATVYAPNGALVETNNLVNDNYSFDILGNDFVVIATPGHTDEHVSYYSKSLNALFCGDTLFAGGCGYLFDGTYAQMHDSLTKLSNLPKETKVYCAHEYSLRNLEFAILYDKNNKYLQTKLQHFAKLRKDNKITLPSSIADEWQINPFFRCQNKQMLEQFIDPVNKMQPLEAFSYLRQQKNNF